MYAHSLSHPDLPCRLLQAAVFPVLRAEWGSSSTSLYNVFVVSLLSPKLPSCWLHAPTQTIYSCCNNTCQVLQASARASTHTYTVRSGLDYSSVRTVWDSSLSCSNILNKFKQSHHRMLVYSFTYQRPSLSAASQPADCLRSSFCI